MSKDETWIRLEKGIRCKKHPTRKHGVKPDTYFVLRFAVDGKMYQEALGWASEGITLAKARVELARLKEAKRLGEGPRSLRERRDIAEEERKAREEEELQKQRNQILFSDFWTNTYLPSQLHKADSSMVSEKALWKNWIKPAIGHIPVAKLTEDDLESLKSKMIQKGKAPATIKYAMAVISQIWTKAMDKGIVSTPSPTQKVMLPKKDNRRQRYLSKEEAHELLKNLKDRCPTIHDMAIVSMECGLRFGEITALTWADCDFEKRQLFIRDPKAKANRFAFMTKNVYSVLSKRYENRSGNLIFPDENGNRMAKPSHTFKRIADELFNKNISDPRLRVCFHSLRHTFASWLVGGGVSLYEVKELMGHASIVMTQRYSHLSPEGLRVAIKILEE